MTNMSPNTTRTVAGTYGRQVDGTYLPDADQSQRTGWVGWIAYAAVMMMLLGIFHIVQGLVAIFNDSYYAVPEKGLLITVDYTTWGWVHTIGGVIIVLAALGLGAGKTWARLLAVLLAFGSILTNVAFLEAAPLWGTLMIVVNLLVVWALIVHGDEMRPA